MSDFINVTNEVAKATITAAGSAALHAGKSLLADGIVYESDGVNWDAVTVGDFTASSAPSAESTKAGQTINIGGIVAENIGGFFDLKTSKKPHGQFYKKLDGRVIIDSSLLTDSAFSYAGATNTHSMLGSGWFSGSNAVQVVNTGGSGGTLNVSRTLSSPIAALGSAPTLLIPIYIPDYTKVNGITILLGSSSAFSTAWKYTYNIGPSASDRLKYNGWHLVKVGTADWVADGGTPPTDWSWAITDVRIKWVSSSSTGDSTIAFDDWQLNHKAKAKIVIITDQTYYASNYTFLRQLTKSLNIPVTMAITPYWIGTAGKMTLDQIKELVAEGNSLAVRTNNAFNTFSTVSDAVAEMKTCQQYLIDNFGAKGKSGSRFAVYNQGVYWLSGSSTTFSDMTLPSALATQCGIVAGRSTKATNYPDQLVNGADNYPPNILHAGIIGSWAAETATYAKARIDEAIDRGTTVYLFWHDIVADGAVGSIDNANDVASVLEYVALKRSQGLIDPVLWDEWYYGLTA